jgi:hypothetical protein
LTCAIGVASRLSGAPGRAFQARDAGSIPVTRSRVHSCLTMSTEISTAGVVPLFSSQWLVFLSSGQKFAPCHALDLRAKINRCKHLSRNTFRLRCRLFVGHRALPSLCFQG